MPIRDFSDRLDALRARLDAPHADPRALHDDARRLLDDMRLAQQDAPADIREALEALDAEILEDFFDNLPV